MKRVRIITNASYSYGIEIFGKSEVNMNELLKYLKEIENYILI